MIIEHRSLKYNPIYKKIYYLHKSMMDRCYLKTCSGYSNYGNKGVTVDKFWHDLNNFIETVDTVDGFELDELMTGKLQLDKDIKIKGNNVYSIENCKFVSPSENAGNRPSDICEFVVVSDKFEISYHTNREKFCRENDLDSSTVWRMLNRENLKSKGRTRGLPYFYKGFQFFYQDGFEMSMINNKRVILATNIDTGESIEFSEIKKFAVDKNINISSISACLYGRQHRAGRWKFEIIKEGMI